MLSRIPSACPLINTDRGVRSPSVAFEGKEWAYFFSTRKTVHSTVDPDCITGLSVWHRRLLYRNKNIYYLGPSLALPKRMEPTTNATVIGSAKLCLVVGGSIRRRSLTASALIVAIITVLQFPPRLSRRTDVIIEFR